jgi:hypothetical protein
MEATVLDATITDSHTARLQIMVTNTGEKRALSIWPAGNCAVFNRYSQTSQPQGVWLGLADDPAYIAESGPRWIADPPDNGAFGDYGCQLRSYASGEAIHTEYRIFDDTRAGGYLKAGTYRFETDVLVTPSVTAERDAETARTFPWGFSLSVDNPN